MITASDEKTIKLWKINGEDTQLIKTLAEHTAGVQCLCKLDGYHFAPGSCDSSIKIWNIDKDKSTQIYQGIHGW